jgi:transcriptional regulator with XRE-family HTH domain
MTDVDWDASSDETLGQRIRRFRADAGITPSQLADRAAVSKSYISSLESETEPERRPSADILYRLAQALGVAMSDLLGRPVLIEQRAERSEELLEFAREDRLPEADIDMLASIQFRGERPRTAARWRFIYEAIKGSERIDRSSVVAQPDASGPESGDT